MSRNDLDDCPTDEELSDLAEKVRQAAFDAMYEELKRIDPQYYYDYSEQLDSIKEDADWIPDRFKSFLTPKPEDFQEKLDAVDEVARMLGTGVNEDEFTDGQVRGKIDDAKGYMEEWQGALSDTFISNFLTPMSSHIVSNQGIAMMILRDDLMAMRNIYVEARKSLKMAGENAITAIESADGISSAAIKTLLTVAAAAFGVGAAAMTGPAAPIVGAVVAGSIAIGTNEVQDDESIPLAADFPDQVVENLRTALDELEKSVIDKEVELFNLISEARTTIGFIGLAGIFQSAADQAADIPQSGTALVPPVPEMAYTALFNPDGLTDGIVQLDT